MEKLKYAGDAVSLRETSSPYMGDQRWSLSDENTVKLRRLILRDFRNYAGTELQLAEGVTVFLGANGQGKSNLLEAVYLAATGKSHRTVHEAEMIRRGTAAARVRAQVWRRGRDEDLEVTVYQEAGRAGVRTRVNGVGMARGAVLGRFPVVLAAAWDLELVRGPGSGRRRLLDAALAQLSPAYYFALHRYHRVVVQRNAELRRRQVHGLEPWDAQMSTLGARISTQRAAYVERLGPQAAMWFARLGGTGGLGLVYRPSWAGGSDEEKMKAARAEMERVRADEYRRGVTLTGPHRDEVEILLDDGALRAYGSQGQWRTATLAVRLAERAVMAVELGFNPVLLLDDALAELDPDRQSRLLEGAGEDQLLVTATTLPVLVHPIRLFRVAAGKLTEERWLPRSAIS